MKKIWSLLFALTIFSCALSLPAFAQQTSRDNMMITNNTRMNNNFDTNSTTNTQTNGYEIDSNRNNSNNYRTNAVTDDNDFDWGWLGLLGLTGLFGLRNRDHERNKK
ncbi:WGxxGxxG family protein [Paenibacillus sp. IHBB 10380]|uniref:WGxxGxxG family protein n=1 Tax=Paenibacillus sp. IHBB 10380 TaxID=1566358 RepID=UPI0005CFE5A1|nr:WGxxGxxG family protein [Paenibacillus sp. IHBB 10380]AJS58490.1 hypothetical protein UB51_08295 [Paenibacillus sp. IHBB 10380]